MKAVIIVVALFIILSLATQVRSQAQSDPKSIVESTIAQAKLKSIHSSGVKWDSISTLMHESAYGAKTVAELKGAFEILMTGLNDKQSLVYNTATKTIIARAEAPSPVASISQTDFKFALLENNICYIQIRTIAHGTSIQEQTAQIRQAIDSLSKGNAMQWIVDLRYASGENNQLMLAAVAPLLDEGLVATTVDNHNTIKNMYTVHNGNLYLDQVAATKFPLWTKDLRKARIAILTSRHTSGAAELLALGLKGRKHSKIFGEPTAGNNFILADVEVASGITMRLAHLRYVDRRGNEYQERIYPDVKVELSATTNVADDRAIVEATVWLTGVQESAMALGMN